jgi:hypothetical protein
MSRPFLTSSGRVKVRGQMVERARTLAILMNNKHRPAAAPSLCQLCHNIVTHDECPLDFPQLFAFFYHTSMHLADLSSELILLIFEHLTLPDIVTMRVLNSEWNHFIEVHESAVFRNCAILHGYVPAGLSLDDAKRITYGSDWLTNVNSWKALCTSVH